MADTRAAKANVRRYAARLNAAAVDRTLRRLDTDVPDSDALRGAYPSGAYPQRRPKLRDSRVVTSTETATRFSTKIRYTAPQANFTEYGTAPHEITAPPGTHLRFYWLRLRSFVAFPRVQHPGSRVHRGWFSRTMKDWRVALRQAQRTTR